MANLKNGEEQIVMTREGYEKLKSELVGLRSEGRMEIGRQLEEARSFGDLSENAEYHVAKEAQAKMESRILYRFDNEQVMIEPWGLDALRVRATCAASFTDGEDHALLPAASVPVQIRSALTRRARAS